MALASRPPCTPMGAMRHRGHTLNMQCFDRNRSLTDQNLSVLNRERLLKGAFHRGYAMRMLTEAEIEYVVGGTEDPTGEGWFGDDTGMSSDGFGTTITHSGSPNTPPSTGSTVGPSGGSGGGNPTLIQDLANFVNDLAKDMGISVNITITPSSQSTFVCLDSKGNPIRDNAGNPVMCTVTQSNGGSASASVNGVLIVN